MSMHETNDLYEIGDLLNKVPTQKVPTPQDISNKVIPYVTEKSKKDLDPVGKEDDDIDNDGDVDETDEYLLKKRKAIKKAIKKEDK